MSYGQVSYSDKAHFSTMSDDHHYSDDVKNGDRYTNGNGIYNDVTVELKPKEYGGHYKLLCFSCKNTKKVKFIMVGALVVFIMALILIIVSAVAHHQSTSKSGHNEKSYGLFAYGPDSSGMITFDPLNHDTYMKYFYRLEKELNDYNIVTQVSDTDRYISCDKNTTTVPEGKVCMQTAIEFGNNCQHTQMYGILEGRPCILLVLKPEKDLTPKLFNLSGTQNIELHRKLHTNWTRNAVPVICEGKTDEDKEALGTDKRGGAPVVYNPFQGFPQYYFIRRDVDGYINPAVMVQFNTVPTHRKVTIKCTAWAENFNDGQPETSPYSTEFTLNIY
ncbi:Atp1b1p [Mactra antiquata]